MEFRDGVLKITGLKVFNSWVMFVLKSDNLDQENTLENPTAVVPTAKEIKISGNKLEAELAPKSFSLYVLKL